MEFLSCILLVLTFALTLQWGVSRVRSKTKLPPGPYPLPIIGNILELGTKPHQSLARLAHIHGPIMRLKLGQVTTIVVSSPHMAKEVLQTHDHSLSDRAVPQSAHAHNHHNFSVAFSPVSPLWRHLRKVSNSHLFSNHALNSNQTLRRNKLHELLHDIHQSSLVGEAVDVGKAVFKASINLLSNTVFSLDLVHSADSVRDFQDLVVKIMEEAGKPNLADFFPVLKMIDPQGIRSRSSVYASKLLDTFRDLIHQRLKLREDQGFDSNNDMLCSLLNIAQLNCQEMNQTIIQHLCLTMFVAGTETIASTLEWAMAELVQNEKAMSKAKQELEEVIGKGKPVEESDIGRLPYLQAVIKETLRVHPSAPFLLPRKANANVEIGGYTIPRGAHVLVNVWAIGRNSSVWENANVFSPDRFLNSDVDVKGQNFELTPFGGGRRICVGLPLAMRMLHLMLGSLLNCFNWKVEEDGLTMNMDDKFGITLAKAQPLRIIPEKVIIK